MGTAQVMAFVQVLGMKGMLQPGLNVPEAISKLSTVGNEYSRSFKPSTNTSPLIRTTPAWAKSDYGALAANLQQPQRAYDLHKLISIYEGR